MLFMVILKKILVKSLCLQIAYQEVFGCTNLTSAHSCATWKELVHYVVPILKEEWGIPYDTKTRGDRWYFQELKWYTAAVTITKYHENCSSKQRTWS